MAGTAQHGPTTDRQATWSTAQVDEWLQDKLPIVRDVAVDTKGILDSLGVRDETRARLRELLVV
jgi:hypothetical protein